MREIKFRAWDVENQEMIDADSLAFDYYEPLCDQLRDSDEMKFMQFTGLTDKNGVEIYEGDVIQYGTPPTHQSSVFWSPQDFGFVTYNKLLGEYTGLSFFTGYKNFEVIGNIHQHPELLEGDK